MHEEPADHRSAIWFLQSGIKQNEFSRGSAAKTIQHLLRQLSKIPMSRDFALRTIQFYKFVNLIHGKLFDAMHYLTATYLDAR